MIRKTGGPATPIAPKTSTTARAEKKSAPDGTRKLDKAEAESMRDASIGQFIKADDRHASLMEKAKAAAEAVAQFMAMCIDGKGDIRRSANLEMWGLRYEAMGAEAAALQNVATAKITSKRDDVGMKGVVTQADRAELETLQRQHKKLGKDSESATAQGAGLRQQASMARGEELFNDMTALAERTSVVDKRLRWRDARDQLADLKARIGDKPPTQEQQHMLASLGAEKKAAWRNLLAEHQKHKLLSSSAKMLESQGGAITLAQSQGVEAAIAKIVKMQSAADEMSALAKTERLAARGARAQQASSTTSSTGASSSTGTSSSAGAASSARATDTAGPLDWGAALKTLVDAFKDGFQQGRAQFEARMAEPERKAASEERGFIYGDEARDAAKGRTGQSLFGLREALVSSTREQPLGKQLADWLRL